VRRLPFSAEALCRWRLSGDAVPRRGEEGSRASERRNRQALGSGEGLHRVAQTLDRRAHLRLARTMPPSRQGLGMPHPQSARLPAPRLYPSDAPKAMQSNLNVSGQTLSNERFIAVALED